jgi:hypothetical protein
MTDPDDRRSRSRSRSVTPPVAMPQPNFLAQQIPADLNAPARHSTAMLNIQPPTSRVSAVPANSISLNDPDDPFGFCDGPRDNLAPQRLNGVGIVIPPEVRLPANWDAPLQHPMPVVPPMPVLLPLRRGQGRPALNRVGIAIPPEVHLPANWDAPLQHPMPVVPPMPVLVPLRRGRGRAPPNISGRPALHRGRGQAANYSADAQILLQQRQQQQEQISEQLRVEREQLQVRRAEQQVQQQQDDEQRRREAERRNLAWARERQREAQQAFEEEERQNLEAHHRGVNYMRRQEVLEAHTSGGSGSGNTNHQPEAHQRHSEVAASQPRPAQPQQHTTIDIQAALDSARQRDERWMQQIRNRWRNEQQAQEQLQHDEAEEERRRWQEERELIRRQQRLEEVSNNTSRQDLAAYEAANPQEPPANIPLLQAPHHPPFQPIIVPQALLQPPPVARVPARNRRRNQGPRARTAYQEPAARHTLGAMNIECPRCHALHFAAEKLSNSTRVNVNFGMCRLSGQIVLPPFPPPPQDFQNLFDGTSPHSQEFKTNIRQYNSTFAFTSLGVKIDHSVTAGSGPYSFRISGELHHLSGALLPLPNNAPVFAQIYIHDPNEQLNHRQGNNINLAPAVIAIIQGVLNQSHPYAQLYKQAYQIIREKPAEEQNTVVIRLRAERNQDLDVTIFPLPMMRLLLLFLEMDLRSVPITVISSSGSETEV